MNAMTFFSAHGHVVNNIRVQYTQSLHEQGSRGLPVYVDIAPHADFISTADSHLDEVNGFFDFWELRGWILFGIKKRLRFDGGADSASEESLRDEGSQAQALERGGDVYRLWVEPASHAVKYQVSRVWCQVVYNFQMTETEYSGTPLYKKLGFTKAPLRILTINVPREYKGWLGELPKGVALASNVRPPVQAAHVFATESGFLNAVLSTLRVELAQDGFVWVSWAKKTSNVATDITEDVLREIALPIGFVDVKVCAVTEVWSGLKLVIRKSERE